MRFLFASAARPKAVAKQLHIALGQFSDDLKLSHSQELTARLYGYSNWHELTKSVGKSDPSLDDNQVSTEEAEDRHEYMLDKLVSSNVEIDIARYIIASLHPTSARHRLFASAEDLMSHLAVLMTPFEADTVHIFCSPSNTGEMLFRHDGRMWAFPFRRPDISQAVRTYFSKTSGRHPANRIEVSGPFPHCAWRTQWYSNEWYNAFQIDDFFLAKALLRIRSEDWKAQKEN